MKKINLPWKFYYESWKLVYTILTMVIIVGSYFVLGILPAIAFYFFNGFLIWLIVGADKENQHLMYSWLFSLWFD